MTGDAELLTGYPRWSFCYRGFPAGLFFTGLEADGAVGRDVPISCVSKNEVSYLPAISYRKNGAKSADLTTKISIEIR